MFSAYYLVDDAYRCGLLEGTYRSSDYERNLEALSVPSEHRELLEKWKLCGQMINAANNLLAAIEKVNDANFVGGRKKEIIAEARFLRAFAQLYLMKHYAFFWDLDSKYGPLMRRVPGTLNWQKEVRPLPLPKLRQWVLTGLLPPWWTFHVMHVGDG